MGRILFAIIAAVASFVLVESLTCNQCNYGLGSYCLRNTEVNCTTNTSVCFSGNLSFPSISSTVGFTTLGCREPADCNSTTNGTLLAIAYQRKITCCSSDKCNTVQLSGAPSTQMTLSAAVGAALLASVWGSML